METQTLQIRASIGLGPEAYASSGVRYRQAGVAYRGWLRHGIFVPTIAFRARIVPNISLKARISRQQGWPIPELNMAGYELFTDTSLGMRASITQSLAAGSSYIRLKARISPKKTQTLSLKARLISAQYLSMKAMIQPRFTQSQCACTFSIRRVATRSIPVVFYIAGTCRRPTIQLGARIVKTVSVRVSGHFVIGQTTATGPVISLGPFTGTGSTQQTLQMNARISK